MASHLLVRADDHLVIGVRWSGFTSSTESGVAVLTASTAARLEVLFPPQHVGEEASPTGSPAPVQLPSGGGSTVPGWRGVLSGGSRVVVEVAAGARVVLTTQGVLAALAASPVVTAAIELPWRLLISPVGPVACKHPVSPVVSGQVSGMWRTRLVGAELAVRAVDRQVADTPDPAFAPTNSLPLARGSRLRLVDETGQNRPAAVERLELSALGGTLDASGRWPNFEWEHHAVLGRDMRVRTVARGVLYPLGHRAELVQVFVRTFDPVAGGAAVVRATRVLTVVEPVRRAPSDGVLRRGFPLGDIEITTTSVADLAPPNHFTTALPGAGNVLSHFWPTTLTGQVVQFGVRSGGVSFRLPLLFVEDRRPVVDTLASPELARRLAADYGTSRAALPGAALDLVASPQRAAGDVHEVHSITVGGLGDVRDGYRPVLTELELALPALRVLRGDTAASKVRFTQRYLQNAAEDVVLEMLPAQARDIDFSRTADRSGGLVAPKYVANAISRTLGPVSLQALPNPATGVIDPASLFPSDAATLLGMPLKSLLHQLKLPPQITSVPVPGAPPQIRLRWSDVALKSAGPFVARPSTRLDLDVGTDEKVCTVKDFAFELPPGPKAVLRLRFAEVRFSQRGANPPSVDVRGVKAEFLGELKLLEKLQDTVDFGAAGKLLDVSPTGIRVRYALPLAPIAAGVFVMRNISFSASIDIPFTGGPVVVALGFASRANPFQLGVMMFGGGGYVEIQLDRDGLRLFEVALEFGAFVAVDFVIASGEVHALGGVRFALDRGGSVTLTGYLRIGGCVEVLGLVSVSIELCLSMTYRSERNALVGRATLVIEIDLTLWSDSVELDSGEWELAGGSDTRNHPLDDIRSADALQQWRQYRAAFADESGTDNRVSTAARAGTAPHEFRVVFHTTVAHRAGRVVWSPDDRWVVVGAGRMDTAPLGLTVLDAATGRQRWRIDDLWCVDIAVSADATRIAVSTTEGDERRIRMLDAGTGQRLWSVPGQGRLRFSPDSALLGVLGRAVSVLDAATGTLLHHQGRSLASPVFSADSGLLCTGSPALVHSRTGAPVWQLNEHDGFASACAFTDDGGVLVASGRFGTVIEYEPRLVGGMITERSRVSVPDLGTASTQTADTIRFGRDRRVVAFLAGGPPGPGSLRLSTVAGGHAVLGLRLPVAPAAVAMSFRPDGGELAVNVAVGQEPGEGPAPGVTVFDTTTGAVSWRDRQHITDLAFSGDGSRVVSCGENFVRVYEAGNAVRARHDCGAPVSLVAAGGDIAAAVAVREEPVLTVFRAGTGELLFERVHSGAVTSLAVSPDGHSVVTGNTDGRCRHFDTRDDTRWVAKHRGPVNAVAFSADSRFLATASNDRLVRLFDRRAGGDPEDQQPRWTRQLPQAVTHVVIGPAFVVSAAQDRRIRVLALDTGDVLHEFDHDAKIRAVTVSMNGIIASASDDGSASVISGASRIRVEHSGPISQVALNSDGSVLATAGADVRLWRADGTPLHGFTPPAPVVALGFDSSGALVVATEHPVARVLDPVSGEETGRLIHPEPVRCLAFGPGGVVTGCDDNVVRVFEVEP